ncbi:MAG: hypothetical protein ABSF29_02870 [Tepidisphaeraceae bacterium]
MILSGCAGQYSDAGWDGQLYVTGGFVGGGGGVAVCGFDAGEQHRPIHDNGGHRFDGKDADGDRHNAAQGGDRKMESTGGHGDEGPRAGSSDGGRMGSGGDAHTASIDTGHTPTDVSVAAADSGRK